MKTFERKHLFFVVSLISASGYQQDWNTGIHKTGPTMIEPTSDDTCSNVNQTPTTLIQGRRLRLYLVRHGESKANKQGVFAGQFDSPLTERGIIDAKSLGETSEFLIFEPTKQAEEQPQIESHPYRFDAVYSSDLIRAHDTCKLILEGMQTRTQTKLETNAEGHSETSNIRLDDRLRERSYGTLQGMPWSSDRSETDKLWRETHRADELPPIFETDDDIWNRVKLFLLDMIQNELSTTNDNKNEIRHILITSHGGVLRQILMRLIGVDELKKMGAEFDKKRKNRLITPNTSMTILDLSVRYSQQAAKSVEEDENGTTRMACKSTINEDDALPGIKTEMVLFANTDHLNENAPIHDD